MRKGAGPASGALPGAPFLSGLPELGSRPFVVGFLQIPLASACSSHTWACTREGSDPPTGHRYGCRPLWVPFCFVPYPVPSCTRYQPGQKNFCSSPPHHGPGLCGLRRASHCPVPQRHRKRGGIQYWGYVCRTVPDGSTNNTFIPVELLMHFDVSLCELEQTCNWGG